jgi:diguanylate cyclase (GGDEF)-like protein/PAS domain S-box-containing protein
MMDWRYTLYAIFLSVAAALLIYFALCAWRRRGTPGATALTILMVAGAVWAVAYALSLTTTEPLMRIFWGEIKYLGIVAVPLAWLIFALQYTGREGWVTRRALALLAIEPGVALVLIFTNEAHGLFWSSRGSDTTGPFPIIESVYGPWFWVHLSFSYLLLLVGTVFLTQALVSSAHLYREQKIALMVGTSMPWVLNAVNVSGLVAVGSPDPAPLAFAVAGEVFAWSLFRYGPLDLVSVARDVVVEGMGDGVIVLDSQDRVVDLNPSAQRILGCPFSKAVGRPVAQILPGQVALLKRHQGSEEAHGEAELGSGAAARYYDIAISSLRTRKVARAGRLISLRDITERKALEQRLMQQALHDPLTGLPNRTLFMNRLEHALARGRRHESTVAVLFVDLDNFKFVNDSLGHEAGDRLLVAVRNRVHPCLRSEDTIARLGGDEFAILIEDVKYTSEPAYVAERIVEELQAPFPLGGQLVVITPSIGIAISDSRQDSPEHLLREADLAMYQAKEDGKARHRMFDPSMEYETTERLRLENDLRRALQRDEFRMHYQPVVHLGTRQIIGMEALVRWEHPERGVILPDEFVPLAEEIGLIIPIGRWVLREACRQAHKWQKRYPAEPPLSMGVNLSTRQLRDSELVEDVEGLLRETRLDPECLILEITEGAVVGAEEHRIGTLRSLQALGVQFALDDFGTGYSSLSYLKRLPVSLLKIDRSFVERIGQDAEDEVLVSGIVYVASALGLSVVAEGVETPEQVARVKALGCELSQGHYFSEPLSSEAAGELLAAYDRKRHRDNGDRADASSSC